MSLHALPSTSKRRTLHDDVLEQPLRIADAYEWWRPLIEWLAEIHLAGRHHSALMHGTICFTPEGNFDLPYLATLEGCPPEKDSAYRFYYPTPPEAATGQMRDLHALGVAFYFRITGAMPPVADRHLVDLKSHEELWEKEFIRLTEYLLGWPQDLQSAADLLAQCWPPKPAPPMEPESVDPAMPMPMPLSSELPALTSLLPDEIQLDLDPILPEVHFVSQLPNTTTGKSVRHELASMVTCGGAEISEVTVLQALPPGLTFDGAVLTGIPLQAGDYVIEFSCQLKSFSERVPGRTRLTVNPDPRDLWKDLPTDPALPFPKPNTAAASLTDAPLTVLAASRRGRSHAHNGSFRDDEFTIDYFSEGGWYLLAVADGAGSAKFSRRGSQIACETVQRVMAEQFRSAAVAGINRIVEAWAATPNGETEKEARSEFYRILGHAAIQSRKAIEAASMDHAAALKDFNTTLIIVLARPTPQGWFIASFSVGDGGAGLAGVPTDVPCLLTTPDGGEFAGQTVFLTMKEALATGDAILKRLQLRLVPSFAALMVMTDGVSDPRFASDDAMAQPETWQSLWSEVSLALPLEADPPAQAEALLEWLNFWSTGNHDDRTLAILYQPVQPAPPSPP